jgi:hypothetical protein
MAFSEALAERIRQGLARRKTVEEKKMFGGIGFLLNGNLLVGVGKESLIVRLGPEGGGEALQEPHVSAFNITGRSMKGWVLVAPEGGGAARNKEDLFSAAIERPTLEQSILPQTRLQGRAQIVEQRGRVDRLLEPAVHSGGPTGEVELSRRVAGDAEDLEPGQGRVAADLPNRGRPVHAGQPHVEQDDVGLAAGVQVVKRVGPVARRVHLQASPAQQRGQQFALVRVVLHHESLLPQRSYGRPLQGPVSYLPCHAAEQDLEVPVEHVEGRPGIVREPHIKLKAQESQPHAGRL